MVSRDGPLSNDEEEIKRSTLKQHFFDTLAQMKSFGQVIVLENVDPPVGIETLAHVHIFTGIKGDGRLGFL